MILILHQSGGQRSSKLAAGGHDALAARLAQAHEEFFIYEPLAESVNMLPGRSRICFEAASIVCNQVDAHRGPIEIAGQFSGMIIGIVHSGKEDVLDEYDAVPPEWKGLQLLLKLSERVFTVDRHQCAAKFVVCCIEGDRQAKVGQV